MAKGLRATRTALLGIFLGFFNYGCSSGRQAAMELDKVAVSIDKYGFAGISAPFLTVPAEAGKFKLDKPASYFFERALTTVQGGVRTSDAMAVDAQLAIRINIEQALATVAQFNRAKSIADFRDAKRKAGIHKAMLERTVAAATPPPEVSAAAAGLAATALGQAPGTPGATAISMGTTMSSPANNPLVKSTLGMLDNIANAPEPDSEALPGFTPTTQPVPDKPPFSESDRLALATVGRSFSAAAQLPNETFQVSAREALLHASGDFLTQTLLEWFQYPEGNRMADYELFFCPLIVSVKPGYETRKGYQADITINVDLARQRPGANELEYLSERFPGTAPPIQVTGVFPVIDAQVLDEVSSRRRLYAMAFQLATVGFGSTANLFIDYAKKLEQDAKTRTALTVASAYTLGANSFGFRVEPQFVALESPTALDATPGDVLQSRTFPAMAMLLVHRSYLYDRRKDVKKDEGLGSWTKQTNYGASAESVLSAHRRQSSESDANPKFEYLVLRSSVRWSPVKHSSLSFGRHFSEVELWKRAETLDKAAHWVDASQHGKRTLFDNDAGEQYSLLYPGRVPNNYQRAHLSSRILSLRQQALDTQALIRIDHRKPENQVTINSVSPMDGWIDQATVLTIYGTGFEGNIESVTVAGRRCAFAVISNECLVATVPAWQDRTATGGGGSTWPNADPRGQVAAKGDEPHPNFDGEVIIGARRGSFSSSFKIKFNRLTPTTTKPASSGGSTDKPTVTIHRGPGDRITQITTAGDFASSLELLRHIAAALRNETGKNIDIHVEESTKSDSK